MNQLTNWNTKTLSPVKKFCSLIFKRSWFKSLRETNGGITKKVKSSSLDKRSEIITDLVTFINVFAAALDKKTVQKVISTYKNINVNIKHQHQHLWKQRVADFNNHKASANNRGCRVEPYLKRFFLKFLFKKNYLIRSKQPLSDLFFYLKDFKDTWPKPALWEEKWRE